MNKHQTKGAFVLLILKVYIAHKTSRFQFNTTLIDFKATKGRWS